MKNVVCTIAGAVGAFVGAALGGWDSAILTLAAFMAIDYVTGFVVAAVFHKSKKTDSGGLKSHEGWKGLCKKCTVFLLVVVANLLDAQTGMTCIRDGVCAAFIVNETVSILENAALMGIPIPEIITNALDVLTEKATGGAHKEES